MTQSFDLAQAYVTALTGSPDTVMNWRVINDKDKSTLAHNHIGSLRDQWATLCDYNNRGWGVFACINAMDGQGNELSNVHHIRAHCVDLDDPLNSADGYQRAVAAYPQPHFAVQTSPEKYHLYWLVQPYAGNDFYTQMQRKLAQLYNGDKNIIDATRVLRVPGFFHLKADPFLVTCCGIHQGSQWDVNVIANSLQHINVFEHVSHRAPLGDPEMAAPSLEWLQFALSLLNPNELDRPEWMSISAAFKQAGWTLTDEQTLIAIWQHWCVQYDKNDVGENLKLWHSFRDTEVGWATFKRRLPKLNAHLTNSGVKSQPPIARVAQSSEPVVGGGDSGGANPPHSTSAASVAEEILDAQHCAEYFKNCFIIEKNGEIFTPEGRFMNATKFNLKYGGRKFMIDNGGKTTDEPYKAATRSTVAKIPQVDHIRFLPDMPQYAIIKDRMGRKGLNTYLPIQYDAVEGDVSLFLNHLKLIIPNDSDRKIWLDYLAHNIKYPGYKIRWAPLLQSAQGGGKSLMVDIMKHALGDMYVYQPKAPELVASGSKFNAWMRGKLMIIVDEIRIDERRDLVEVLKPMITDKRVEVQAKGVDQDMEDNPANWIFFSNHKDAIPVGDNDRRYAVFYSAIQSKKDFIKYGMDEAYFIRLTQWLEVKGGWQNVTHFFLNYDIEKGAIPQRAPHTSTQAEALKISRSPLHVCIEEAVQDSVQGFRGGYVSSIAAIKRANMHNIRHPSSQAIRSVLEEMGYHELGRALAAYPFEDINQRATVYADSASITLDGYAEAQGYT
jgi:hypothetical protein